MSDIGSHASDLNGNTSLQVSIIVPAFLERNLMTASKLHTIINLPE